MTDTNAPDDFGIAKTVFDELKSLSKDRQERVLRWVAETLGHASLNHLPPIATPPQQVGVSPLTPIQAGTHVGGGAKDIRTFVVEKAPTSDNQFAAVVAYYYQFEAPHDKRRKTIGGTDLQDAARLAGRKRLSNPRMTLKNAKSMGYLDSIARGEFSINTVGENLVAMTLPGGADASARAGRQTRGKTGRKSPVRKTRSAANKTRK